jgi:hypothetical protein
MADFGVSASLLKETTYILLERSLADLLADPGLRFVEFAKPGFAKTATAKPPLARRAAPVARVSCNSILEP